MNTKQVKVPAKDGVLLDSVWYLPEKAKTDTVILINSATAVPCSFYSRFAGFLCEAGYRVGTYDYRGIGGSRPAGLKGFRAGMRDWGLLDMAGMIDWVHDTFSPDNLFVIGHSVGGQLMGLIPDPAKVDALVTCSAQSGYWQLQGGVQKASVCLHMHLTFPFLSHLLGYMPMSWVTGEEDLPRGVALEWARWCRMPGYLLDDASLPLERYQSFGAPVLAYSFDDDNWGTRKSVDAMMKAYPNLLRRHVLPASKGLAKIGHFGFFHPQSKVLWEETLEWLENLSLTG